jgi:hypothetical protein
MDSANGVGNAVKAKLMRHPAPQSEIASLEARLALDAKAHIDIVAAQMKSSPAVQKAHAP